MNKPGFLVSAAFCVLTGCTREQPIQAKQEAGPLPVTAVRVAAREIQRIVESVGTLYAYDEAIISAEVDGRVDRVNIDLGDAVTTGQVLVQIYDEEQRYLLAQNEAQLRQSLERLGLKDEKDRVKDVRETPEVRQAQAEFFEAEQRFKRVRNLVDQGISSRADLDQAQARYQATQAALDATMNQTRNLIQEIERAKAVLELQRKKLRDTTVRAPFAGFVKERQVTVGQYARANTPLLTLVKTNPIRLRLEIPERMAPWVKTDQTVEVALEAFEGRTFRGRIWRISPAVDPSKRTFVAEALIDNPDHQLKPGSYAKARVPTNKRDRILTIPFRSVNYVFGTNKAYVVDDGVIQSRDVKMGDRFDQQVEIVEGLQEGEQVATSQVSRLDNGVKVRVVSDRPGRQTEKGATGSKSTD